MLKVFLADDEPVILRGLAKLIPWEKYGTTIIGEAGSGHDLLKAITELEPDIVITDISMPGLTGIEVLKKLKEMGSRTKVIFISAYQEFSYARDAVAYGAVDYLVKPIDRNKLQDVVEKTVSLIEEASDQMSKQNRLIVYEKQQHSRMIQEFFDLLTEGERVSEEINGEIRGLDPNEKFSVIVVQQDQFPNHKGKWVEGEMNLLKFAMQNVIEEVIQELAKGWVTVKKDHLLAVVKHSEPLAAEELAVNIQQSLNRFLKLSVTVSIGLPEELERTAESYRQAQSALSYKFFIGTNRIFCYRTLPPAPLRGEQPLETMEKLIVRALISPRSSVLDELIGSALQEVQSLVWGNREYAVNLCYAMLLGIFRGLTLEGFPYCTDKEEQQLLAQRLGGCETFNGMASFIRDELVGAMSVVNSQSGNKEKLQLLQVKDYIERHYAEEISLERMAAISYLNPYYFSTFFKKHTGHNFKQYLTEVRMGHALRLLQQTDLMVYEIAEKVGYNNARQFSDMFKKQFGKLPNEMRQS